METAPTITKRQRQENKEKEKPAAVLASSFFQRLKPILHFKNRSLQVSKKSAANSPTSHNHHYF
jgi:hypothetical protein